jgi:protein TonB
VLGLTALVALAALAWYFFLRGSTEPEAHAAPEVRPTAATRSPSTATSSASNATPPPGPAAALQASAVPAAPAPTRTIPEQTKRPAAVQDRKPSARESGAPQAQAAKSDEPIVPAPDPPAADVSVREAGADRNLEAHYAIVADAQARTVDPPAVADVQRIDPRPIDPVEPVYPQHARARGERGTVVLDVLVNENGDVVRVVVAQGTPGSDLEASAIDAVLRRQYQPATDNGRPVRGWVRETFVFEP